MDRPEMPRRFALFLGGYTGPCWQVVSPRRFPGELRYEMRQEEEVTRRVVPSTEEWHAFWADLDRLGVWKWRREYFLPLLDGTQWSVKLRTQDGRWCHSFGSNAFPPHGEGPEPCGAFPSFCGSVRRLLGGLPFGSRDVAEDLADSARRFIPEKERHPRGNEGALYVYEDEEWDAGSLRLLWNRRNR